jgi:hypothetical protein
LREHWSASGNAIHEATLLFRKRKIPLSEEENLLVCPLETVHPFALLLAPSYVRMALNEKFVAVKGPLDFFTPEELQKVKGAAFLYSTQYVETVLPFRSDARNLVGILEANPTPKELEDGQFEKVAAQLGLTPYERSAAVAELLSRLWFVDGDEMLLEPYFNTVFVNELCGPLSAESLNSSRENDTGLFESALIDSAWVVFFALHFGVLELNYLKKLRAQTFDYLSTGKEIQNPGANSPLWLRQPWGHLLRVLRSKRHSEVQQSGYLADSEEAALLLMKALKASCLSEGGDLEGRKFADRTKQIRALALARGNAPMNFASLFAEGGWLHE